MDATTQSRSTGTTESSTTTELSKDVIFDILSNDRRRYVLKYLRQQGRPVELRELSRQVAAWENEIPPEQISFDQRKRVYTALQQAHLPKMEQTGVIEYDTRQGVVTPSKNAAALDVYLTTVTSRQFPWDEYYVGLGVASLVLVTAVWLDVTPFTVLSDVVWAALVASAITASGFAHTYRTRGRRERTEELRDAVTRS